MFERKARGVSGPRSVWLLLLFAALVAVLAVSSRDAEPAIAAGTIQRSGIDLAPGYPAMNTGTSIGGGTAAADPPDIQNQISNMPLGLPFAVDIFVSGVPVAGSEGLYGIGGELIYDPTRLRVADPVSGSSLPTLQYTNPGGSTPSETYDPRPDNDGSFRFDSLDLSDSVETGSGVVLRLTMECLATTIGGTFISLTDSVTGGGSKMAVLAKDTSTSQISPYTVTTESEGTIYCNENHGEVSDLETESVAVNTPASAPVNTAFNVTVDANVTNNGPGTTTVTGDVAVSLVLPSGCSAPGGSSSSISNISLEVEAVVPIPTQTFSVSCSTASTKSIGANVSIALDPGQGTLDPFGGNNSLTSFDQTDISGTGDLEVSGVVLSGPAGWIPNSQFTLAAMAQAGNLGPDGVAYSVVMTLTLPGGCTTSSANPQTAPVTPPVSGTVPVNASWGVTCTAQGAMAFSVQATANVPSPVTDPNMANNGGSDGHTVSVLVDGDGDGVPDVEDNCPMTPNANQANADSDSYGDACETSQCVNIWNDWTTPVGDDDCDGFTTANENQIGTMAVGRCALTVGLNDEPPPDRWPVDFNDNRTVNTIDVGFFVPRLGSSAPGPPYDVRYDFNANGTINTIDVGRFVPFLGKTCPP